jgi:hypothetical protein
MFSFGHSSTHENRVNTVFSSQNYERDDNMGAVVLLKLSSPPFSSSSANNIEHVVNNKLAPVYEKQYEKQKMMNWLLAELDEKVRYMFI